MGYVQQKESTTTDCIFQEWYLHILTFPLSFESLISEGEGTDSKDESYLFVKFLTIIRSGVA